MLIGGLIAAGGLAESDAPGWTAWVAGVAAVTIFLGGGFVWPLLLILGVLTVIVLTLGAL